VTARGGNDDESMHITTSFTSWDIKVINCIILKLGDYGVHDHSFTRVA